MQEPILQDFKKTEPVISYAGFLQEMELAEKGCRNG